MADVLGIVGAVTGCIGAVTGIAGAVMGWIGYKSAADMKALDLRVEIQKIESDTRAVLRDLPTLIDQAVRSRKAVNSARGKPLSSPSWESECQVDRESVEAFVENLERPPPAGRHHGVLEQRLAGARNTERRANLMQGKYRGLIAEDDRERDHIREDQRANPPKL